MQQEDEPIFVDAEDAGFRFILGHPEFQSTGQQQRGGLFRRRKEGHLVTIVGQGGTGKSILALQLVASLLKSAHSDFRKAWGEKNKTDQRPHTAFYFSLEASPYEIELQMQRFEWGKRLTDPEFTKPPSNDASSWRAKCIDNEMGTGEQLIVAAVPSPAEDLGVVIDQVRQTVARELSEIACLVAVVIDPLGGVRLNGDLRRELSRLKSLATNHRTFVFLLVEDYIYDRHPSIEHYSQTIIHLQHDPRVVPCRQLYIQKARWQVFASGHHQLKIDREHGIHVFPSIEAQSNYAHELLIAPSTCDKGEPRDKGDTHGERTLDSFLRRPIGKPIDRPDTKSEWPNEVLGEPVIPRIEPGSVVFLMGPPGTFKQHVTTRFSIGDPDTPGENCLYVSFKADRLAVQQASRPQGGVHDKWKVWPLPPQGPRPGEDIIKRGSSIFFYDARSPVLTPEEILEVIRREVEAEEIEYSRAVVWGLRRLNDMPNLAGGKSVQFLEALVTLLTAYKITSLLIDWPDIEKASTLPIVDLSQYIFLTRVCRDQETAEWKLEKGIKDRLWQQGSQQEVNHVALLRIQRTPEGFHRDLGVMLYRTREETIGMDPFDPQKDRFEAIWHLGGHRWERDPSLIQGTEWDYYTNYPWQGPGQPQNGG